VMIFRGPLKAFEDELSSFLTPNGKRPRSVPKSSVMTLCHFKSLFLRNSG
jgi:hypothetical protein